LHILDKVVWSSKHWAYFQSSGFRVHALTTFLMESFKGKMQGHKTNTLFSRKVVANVHEITDSF